MTTIIKLMYNIHMETNKRYKFNQEDNDMKIFFEAKPVLAIAIVTAIEGMVEKDEGVFSADELNELERIAKAIERQVHETN